MTAANLPREARALLDAIAVGESDPMAKHEGISPYFILYGGGSFEKLASRDGYYGFPAWAGKDNSHAAGRYQFQPATWLGTRARFGTAIPNFRNPDDQDWGGWFLAMHDYRARTQRELLTDLRAGLLDNIGSVLQPTWTSLSNATFPQRYRAALATMPADRPTAPLPPTAPSVPGSTPGAARTQDVLEAAVRMMQVVLDVAGYYSGPIDGVPNEAMYAGLEAYRAGLESAK